MRNPNEDHEAWPIQRADSVAINDDARLAHPLHDRTHRCILPRAPQPLFDHVQGVPLPEDRVAG